MISVTGRATALRPGAQQRDDVPGELRNIDLIVRATYLQSPSRLGSSRISASCRPLSSTRDWIRNGGTHAPRTAEREIPLIEDDIYADLHHGPVRPRAAKAYDQKGLVLLCSSVSKMLAPGYRVGWVAPGRFFREVEHLKLFNTFSKVSLTQLAIAELLHSGGYDRFLRRVRGIYAHQIARMAEAVGRHIPAGTRVTCPGGGFLMWVELPPRVDALQLYPRALQVGVTFAPGPIFSPSGGYWNFLRLNAAVWNDAVEGAVQRLGALAGER